MQRAQGRKFWSVAEAQGVLCVQKGLHPQGTHSAPALASLTEATSSCDLGFHSCFTAGKTIGLFRGCVDSHSLSPPPPSPGKRKQRSHERAPLRVVTPRGAEAAPPGWQKPHTDCSHSCCWPSGPVSLGLPPGNRRKRENLS